MNERLEGLIWFEMVSAQEFKCFEIAHSTTYSTLEPTYTARVIKCDVT